LSISIYQENFSHPRATDNKSYREKKIESLTSNKNNPNNPTGPIDLVLRREVSPSKTSTEKKQL